MARNLLGGGSLRYNGEAVVPGAQTERRGGAGPMRGLLGGKDLTGRFFEARKSGVGRHRGRSQFGTFSWSGQGWTPRPARRQKSPAETTSPPARVTRRAKTRMSVLAFRKWTEPSAISTLAPPG